MQYEYRDLNFTQAAALGYMEVYCSGGNCQKCALGLSEKCVNACFSRDDYVIEHSDDVLNALGVVPLSEEDSNRWVLREEDSWSMEQMVIDFCHAIGDCRECPFDIVVPNGYSCSGYAEEYSDTAIQMMLATGYLIFKEDGTYETR